MKLSGPNRIAFALTTLIALVLLGGAANAADAYRVIYDFGHDSQNGWAPTGLPAVAKNGDLYGVTHSGGDYNWGTVYKLTAPQTRSGAWTKSTLYNFPSDKQEFPTSLVIDEDGVLYGAGGGPDTRGFIFRMTPPISGDSPWVYETLYTFKSGADGSAIQGNLVFDAEGNLYGATELGGDTCVPSSTCGTVFKLKRPTKEGARWRFSVLYTFTGSPDGAQPFAGLAFDQKGNLFGTTWEGGTFGWGAVYRLSPPTKKRQGWTESVIYSFNPSNDGIISPEGPVIVDKSGAIYGTTPLGGDLDCQGGYGCGVVFELSPSAKKGKAWSYATLYAFQGGDDGVEPKCYMVFDSKGNLYSTTQEGGGGKGYSGIAFRLSPPERKGGAWTESVLHRFVAPEGGGPNDGLTWGKWNDIYGLTWEGGSGCEGIGCGTAFELRP